jgi:N,N'-diacetyllegionaminate synthase
MFGSMRVLEETKIFLIAEIAQAHEGSLGIAHSYIDALATTGVDAVKFQTHIAEAESSAYEPFRVNFSYQDQTRLDYWKRMEFTEDQWIGLKEHCDKVNLEFISSPFSNKAVDLLERVGVKRYKIGSGEISNFLLLERVSRTEKPVILSSGMSTVSEIEEAINYLRNRAVEVSVLQCTTAYPTKAEEWGLNVMTDFMDKFSCPVGFSDHSGDIFACLAATSLGAQILEFHVVFDHKMFGPDAKASLTIEQISQLVNGVRQIEKSLSIPVDKSDTARFESLKVMFGKSLAINKDLKIGHTLTFEDLESKKPGNKGIPARDYQSVIGKTLLKNKNAYEFLEDDDIQE